MTSNKSRFKSRKVLRKEARKAKKARRNEYYANRGKQRKELKSGEKVKKGSRDDEESDLDEEDLKDEIVKPGSKFKNLQEEHDYEIKKERREKKILEEEIKKKRIERLMKDNVEEEKEIKKLEKQLKFRKGKRSATFALDGLDYLLDVCDKKISQNEGEKAFEESDEEFENDLATIMGKSKSKSLSKKAKKDDFDDDDDDDDDDGDVLPDELAFQSDSDIDSEKSLDDLEEPVKKTKGKNAKSKNKNDDSVGEDRLESYVEDERKKSCKNEENAKNKKNEGNKRVKFDVTDADDEDDENIDDVLDEFENPSDFSESDDDDDLESDVDEPEPPRKKLKAQKKSVSKESKKVSLKKDKTVTNEKNTKEVKKKKKKKKDKGKKKQAEVAKQELDEEVEDEDSKLFDSDIDSTTESSTKKQRKKSQDSDVWEDIYGRTRDKEGNVVKTYKPPQIRKILSGEASGKNQEKILRLKRQLKGLLNRLAENNMASIATQIEELYMSNSRNEMNETLRNLYSEALISEILTPERLITEHAMLISILHANVGSEVGAYFLQFAATQFDKLLKEDPQVEDKRINNLMLFIMHLYNFQIFHSKLLYDMMNELLKNLQEKQIELLLLTLRTVGFSLRKADPVALKTLVLKIQEKANSLKSNDENYSRMKFMLETVSAIKNNNVSKIPNYNPEPVEHLKKSMRVLVRKGNYNTELNISLRDLLNAEEHGRWWVVGSAWSGTVPNDESEIVEAREEKDGIAAKGITSFSQKLLDLAKKQRMNTDIRRTIFCTLMSAEDYLDAFEKLLKLGLKGAVEREIINVLVHCALHEKDFNPYYFHLANKFCIFDRKYQMMLQYAAWDKFRELQNMLPVQVTNLAKFIGNVILGKGLPLSVLKVIQFSELDKVSVKFIRQVLLTILLTDEETVAAAFSRIVHSPKLKVFRDGLRLFLHHFVLKNVKSNPDGDSNHLIEMVEVADKALTSSDLKLVF